MRLQSNDCYYFCFRARSSRLSQLRSYWHLCMFVEHRGRGNLPFDSAILLEFLSGSHQYLLTILSVFWAIAQLLAHLIAWPLFRYHICGEKAVICTKSQNFGWRYFMFTMGGIALVMFAVRLLLFTLYESPKFLVGRGKDDEAVRVVHEVARRNGKPTNLTLADLEIFNQEGQQGINAHNADLGLGRSRLSSLQRFPPLPSANPRG